MSEAPAIETPGIGHNAPVLPTPEELRAGLEMDNETLIARKDELLEAFERTPETIEDDEVAGRVQDFVKQIDACRKNASAGRVAAKEPYLDGGRTVDGFFKAITEPLEAAKKELGTRVTAYLRKKKEAERQRRVEEERRAREEAERKQREAEARAAAAKTEQDLDKAIEAEEAADAAEQEAIDAARAAEANAADMSRTRGEYGSVGSLRTRWVHDEATLDRKTLDLEALRQHIPETALHQAVRSYIKAGGRELRGARIYESQEAVIR